MCHPCTGPVLTSAFYKAELVNFSKFIESMSIFSTDFFHQKTNVFHINVIVKKVPQPNLQKFTKSEKKKVNKIWPIKLSKK